jgi:hypothetical protein
MLMRRKKNIIADFSDLSSATSVMMWKRCQEFVMI